MFDETFQVKPPIAVPADARELHDTIKSQLSELLDDNYSSCLDSDFRKGYSRVLELLQLYQQKIIAGYDRNVTCFRGCSWCCNHWVEDVNSFEAEIIADYIQKKMPSRIEEIKTVCRQDLDIIVKLDRIVSEKVAEEEIGDEDENMFLLLSAFYRMKRPCPLLDKDKNCTVYSVRPLTCRVYMSFSSPCNCHPENINENDIPTYIMDLEEDANEIIDKLHFKYQKFGDDTGLRSLLLKYLDK